MARTPWPLQSLLGHGCPCFTKAPCAQFRGGPGRWHIMANRGCSDAWLLPGWMVKGWWSGSRGLWFLLVVVMVMVVLACWQGLFLRTFVWMVGKRWSSGCHMQVMIMLIHQLSQDHSKRHLSSPALHLMAALSALPRTIPSSSKKVTVSPWFIQLFPQKSYLPSTFSSIDSPGLGPRDLRKTWEETSTFFGRCDSISCWDVLTWTNPFGKFQCISWIFGTQRFGGWNATPDCWKPAVLFRVVFFVARTSTPYF